MVRLIKIIRTYFTQPKYVKFNELRFIRILIAFVFVFLLLNLYLTVYTWF